MKKDKIYNRPHNEVLVKSQDGIKIIYPPEMESINGYAVSRRLEHLEKIFNCIVTFRSCKV